MCKNFNKNTYEENHQHVGGVDRYLLLREKSGVEPLPSKDAAIAKLFIQKYWRDIVAKWVDFFVYKRIVKTTKINDKL